MCTRGFDVNTRPADGGAEAGRPSSPSSMQEASTRQQVADQEAADDEDNGGGGARKKLRLSKEQSSFLEDSFKEHSTLTPVCVVSCSIFPTFTNLSNIRPHVLSSISGLLICRCCLVHIN